MRPTEERSDARRTARELIMRGFKPIPIPRGSKNPGKGWNRLSVTEAEVDGLFAPDGNIGIRLGAPSGGLVDVDLDCDEAVLLRGFLEPTDLRHGRPGRLSSHHFYLCDDAGRRVCFKDPVSRKMICELRGDGLQTLVPPSIHPEDEQLAWEAFGDPARGSWDALLEQLGVVAAGALGRQGRRRRGVPGSCQRRRVNRCGLGGGTPGDRSSDPG
jgi:putative DNA primase/helicase